MEMDEVRGIVAVSIPFTAGAGLAALTGTDAACAGAACCLCVLLMISATFSKGRDTGLIMALFLAAGFFCMASSELAPVSPKTHKSGVLESFCSIIDGLPFGHRETNALVKALLTGRRDTLDKDLVLAFRNSGASHVLALSGLHLGVIYGIISKVLVFLGETRTGKVARCLICISACIAYTVMTGAGPSITRACLFIILNETGRLQPGRRKSPIAILCTALTLQLAISPKVITSAGFQLSYLAMLGIFTIYPELEKWYPSTGIPSRDRLDMIHRLWSVTAITLSCQLLTAPVVWLRFGTPPKLFLITNIIVLPLTELLILGSIICIATGAAGLCPEWMLRLTDMTAQAMISSLQIISGM